MTTTRPAPIPVIVCDRCEFAPPARFGGSALTDPVPETARQQELIAAGWLLTNTRDLCPRCNRPGINHEGVE
ncbi:hypothetical protein GCM10022215_18240 [Nocardioides fonticola]|uniref:HNH endonuclease n=1 Tax=Nocardioides fonticola TaxID=450363 RepID=A0ABP7XHN2_9ACTN